MAFRFFIVQVAATLLIATGGLQAAVSDALSSGYCPKNKAIFLLALLAQVVFFCMSGIALVGLARYRARLARFKSAAYLVAPILVMFALGAGALDLFGLSGCGSHATEGLTWDWPW